MDLANTASAPKGGAGFGLSGNQLKIIAMLAMLADHIGLCLLPELKILRVVGRLAFPIFAYMIAEGCRYTRHRGIYLARLATLAAGCQVVYTVFGGGWHLNILITFSMAIATIFAIDGYIKQRNLRSLLVMIAVLAGLVFVEGVAPVLFAEQGFHPDYGALGVMLPMVIYFARNKWEKLLLAAVILLAMAWGSGGVQWFSLLALPLLLCYHGKKGKMKLKYMFYIFYPAHLAVIYLIQYLWF